MQFLNTKTDYKRAHRNIIKNGVKYLRKYPKVEFLILGLSGGIDSTLTAALARDICKELPHIKLMGYSIPIESNTKDEVYRAEQAGLTFCHCFNEVHAIEKLYEYYKLYDKNSTDIAYGNIKARLRMMYLYDQAYKMNGLVLSTDNYTEYMLGFWTLHGDVGDLGLLQNLWKTEVYRLAEYLGGKLDDNEKEVIEKACQAVPTDGLGISESDFDQLGEDNYEQIDNILFHYLELGDDLLKDHPVIQRHLNTEFKRNNPFNIMRKEIIK